MKPHVSPRSKSSKAMESIVIEEDSDDDETPQEPTSGGSKWYLRDLQKEGWEAIGKMNVRKQRRDAQQRDSRKKEIMQYIIKRVKEAKENSTIPSPSLFTDDDNAESAPWSEYLHQTRPSYYY